ncbi:MAG: hypothetical protein AAGJ18_05935 [Bacteroidota bacterium]
MTNGYLIFAENEILILLRKILIVVGNLLCFLLLLFLPTKISKGCGPYDRSFYGYTFLNPNIIDLDAPTAPYFAGFEKIFRQLRPTEDVQQSDNLTEWQERFCDVPKLLDLQQVIYKSSTTQLRRLKTVMQQKNARITGLLASNSFARHLQKNKCEEAVDYLIFAKRCEPHVVAGNNWTPNNRDTVAMQFLIKDGLKEFKKTKSHYFRLRYAYQLVRLAHYKKNYTQALALYDFLMPKTDNDPSIIEDWILGHKAGALMGLGRNVEAAYLYSKIFQNTPSKRQSAYRSFLIKSDEEWLECLKLCQSDAERATLYALRANDPNSNAVEEMAKIYELNPKNEHLEQLLVREIQKLERDLLGIDFNKKKKSNRRFHKIPRKQAGKYLLDLLQLVLKVSEENKVNTADLWHIAEGYLELLGGDYYAAKNTLEDLKGSINSAVLEEQLEALIMVANIDGLEEVNTKMEDLIVDYERNELFNKYPDFGKFVKDKLTHLYAEQGFRGKAFLEEYTLKELKLNPQLPIIEELIAICQKEGKSKLEKEMVMKSDGLTTIESDLWDLKGTYFLGQMQLESALEAYRQMPRKDRDNFGLFNPFREEFVDCVHCRVIDTAAYNKTVILEQILELEYKGKADMERGAYYYYQIGNALYNMTYFGYEWEVADYFRSGSSWYGLKTGDNVFAKPNAPFGNRETVNCSLPLYYYDKAFRLAQNDELSARAAFMAAKCQQNLYFTEEGADYTTYGNQIPYVPNEYRQYFKIIKDYYTDTQFFSEVVQECLFYEMFAFRN